MKKILAALCVILTTACVHAAENVTLEKDETGTLVINDVEVPVHGADTWDILTDPSYSQWWVRANAQLDSEQKGRGDIYLGSSSPVVNGFSLSYRLGVRYLVDLSDEDEDRPVLGPTLGVSLGHESDEWVNSIGLDTLLVDEGGTFDLNVGTRRKDMFRTGDMNQWSWSPGLGASVSLADGSFFVGPTLGLMNLEHGKGMSLSAYGVAVSELSKVNGEIRQKDYHIFPFIILPILQDLLGMRSAFDVLGIEVIPPALGWIPKMFEKKKVGDSEVMAVGSNGEQVRITKVSASQIKIENVWTTTDGSCLKTRYGECWSTGQ